MKISERQIKISLSLSLSAQIFKKKLYSRTLFLFLFFSFLYCFVYFSSFDLTAYEYLTFNFDFHQRKMKKSISGIYTKYLFNDYHAFRKISIRSCDRAISYSICLYSVSFHRFEISPIKVLLKSVGYVLFILQDFTGI